MDENGDAVCAEPMAVQRARGFCSFTQFGEIADDIVSLITQAQKKVTTSAATDYIVHTGKDDWVECMDIFRKSAVEGGTKTVTRVTDDCVRELPDGAWDWWSLCNADWGSNPEDPYCQDPCCNYDLQSSMCCAAQEVSYEVPAPSFDFDAVQLHVHPVRPAVHRLTGLGPRAEPRDPERAGGREEHLRSHSAPRAVPAGD